MIVGDLELQHVYYLPYQRLKQLTSLSLFTFEPANLWNLLPEEIRVALGLNGNLSGLFLQLRSADSTNAQYLGALGLLETQ